MIELTDIYKGKSRVELEHLVSEYYRNNFQGKCVTNKELNIEICFNAIGRKKTAFGGRRERNLMTSYKATAIIALDKLIENAKFVDFGIPKQKHKENFNAVIFFNFVSTCKIDGKEYNFKLSAIMREDDFKIHYSINEDY